MPMEALDQVRVKDECDDCELGHSTSVSPSTPSGSWMDWSHAWGGEMCLKKALEKLNLEYPHDSND